MISRNTPEYIKTLRGLIEPIVSRVYWRNAPEHKTFPYAVIDTRGVGDYTEISVTLWGAKGGEVALQTLADMLEGELDGTTTSDATASSVITTNNDMRWIPDEDENIIRIDFSFSARYFS